MVEDDVAFVKQVTVKADEAYDMYGGRELETLFLQGNIGDNIKSKMRYSSMIETRNTFLLRRNSIKTGAI